MAPNLARPNPSVNGRRQWRKLSDPNDWLVTPETARLLEHWRHFNFNDVRPFFCQVEAVETLILLTEVAPKAGRTGKRFLDHIDAMPASEGELRQRRLEQEMEEELKRRLKNRK